MTESDAIEIAVRRTQRRFILVLGLLSFATVVFLLCIFRLLTFFIMPSIFFDLLFIGFPIGAFLGARYFKPRPESFAGSLRWLRAAMAATIVLSLACKHADYLRARFYDLETGLLFRQIGMFAALFLPFFIAYGLAEFTGFQLGMKLLQGRLRAAYAAFLFGAGGAYAAVHFGLAFVGVARLMIGAILLVALIALAVLPKRRGPMIEAAICALALLWPGLEPEFLDLYKGTYLKDSIRSTKGIQQERGNWQPIYQRWGHFALVELMESQLLRQTACFYNDVYQWNYVRGSGIPSEEGGLDAIPFRQIAKDGRVLVIGAGGGRQVKWALSRHDFKEIVAVELEPEVFRIARRVHPEKFDRVFEDPRVRPVRAEGRTYLASSEGSFDLIFMPSVGGYAQMMLEPGNMIRTQEAYALMRDKLTATGVLAVWYPRGLDPKGILTTHYLDTFRGLGLVAEWYGNSNEVLILASRHEPAVKLDLDKLAKDLPQTVVIPVPHRSDGPFQPITDERPFLAGNIRHLFNLDQVANIFQWVIGVVLALGVVTGFLLRTAGDPKVPRLPYPLLAVASLLVGANFVAMEHALVIALFRELYVFYDALVLGAVAFLALTGLGSIYAAGGRRGVTDMLFLVLCVLLAASPWLPIWVGAAAVFPAAFCLGGFFPSLFEIARRAPLAVFAFDAVGAALGSACSFFIPIVFGLSKLSLFAAVVGIVTLAIVRRVESLA
ncbi:MAG TPA: hypothetical protein VNC50_02370, partial [Planctomycetia bacterium]|nr:hypothetical protein [Planctomycetia bacterium]